MIFLDLFFTFFLIGLFTFGGGYAMIPLIEAQVLSKGWMDSALLYDFIAISECTPGPFAVNIATFIGARLGGIGGSICAVIGVVLPSFIIILLLATVLKRFAKNKFYKGAINGVKPIVIALISSTVIMLVVKSIFFGGQSLTSEFNFDRKILSLFLMLLGYSVIYNKVNKKPLKAIPLLLLSALVGIIVFGLI